jgi:hypothetical protein
MHPRFAGHGRQNAEVSRTGGRRGDRGQRLSNFSRTATSLLSAASANSRNLAAPRRTIPAADRADRDPVGPRRDPAESATGQRMMRAESNGSPHSSQLEPFRRLAPRSSASARRSVRPGYFPLATSFWNLGLLRSGSKLGSILSQPG